MHFENLAVNATHRSAPKKKFPDNLSLNRDKLNLRDTAIKKTFLVCCSSWKVVQKTRPQYIEILSLSKDIYI